MMYCIVSLVELKVLNCALESFIKMDRRRIPRCSYALSIAAMECFTSPGLAAANSTSTSLCMTHPRRSNQLQQGKALATGDVQDLASHLLRLASKQVGFHYVVDVVKSRDCLPSP